MYLIAILKALAPMGIGVVIILVLAVLFCCLDAAIRFLTKR